MTTRPEVIPTRRRKTPSRLLENDVPRIRDRIRTNGHQSWTEHQDVLVDFAVMMATRSPLFRTQAHFQVRSSLADGSTGDVLAKNFSITSMRNEMRRRSQQWKEYHWVLGYTKEPEHPFIASDQVVGMRGNALTSVDALRRNDFWLWCPLSWDMCLIASSLPLDAGPTADLLPEDVSELQTLARRQAAKFVASPVPISRLTAG